MSFTVHIAWKMNVNILFTDNHAVLTYELAISNSTILQ